MRQSAGCGCARLRRALAWIGGFVSEAPAVEVASSSVHVQGRATSASRSFVNPRSKSSSSRSRRTVDGAHRTRGGGRQRLPRHRGGAGRQDAQGRAHVRLRHAERGLPAAWPRRPSTSTSTANHTSSSRTPTHLTQASPQLLRPPLEVECGHAGDRRRAQPPAKEITPVANENLVIQSDDPIQGIWIGFDNFRASRSRARPFQKRLAAARVAESDSAATKARRDSRSP